MKQMMASSSAGRASIILIGAICLFTGLILTEQVSAINLVDQLDQSAASGKSSVTVAVVENPELVVRVLDNLLRSILYSTNIDYQATNSIGPQKRGLDLGISRGFSGSQAGKHLMGLSAASFANGPGKR